MKVAVLKTDDVPVCLSWIKSNQNVLSYSYLKGPIKLWTYQSGANSVVKDSGGLSSGVTLMRWHHQTSGRVVVGHKDGSLSLFQGGLKSRKHYMRIEGGSKDGADEVVALEWDCLSEDYLLVANASSGVRMLDMTTSCVVMVFVLPRVATAVRCLSWLDDAPGMFVTGGEM